MLDVLDKELMLKFLRRNFPVSRIKYNNQFRRAIVIDDGSYYLLGERNQLLALINKLNVILIIVFSCDIQTSKDIVNIFLSIDKKKI